MANNSPISVAGGQKKKTGTVRTAPSGQKKAFTAAQVADLTDRLADDAHQANKGERAVRDYALFRVAVCSMLRASDLLNLRLIDVWDRQEGVRREFTVTQKKTQRHTTCFIADQTQQALSEWLHLNFGAALYPLPKEQATIAAEIDQELVFPISDRQYRNIVHAWAQRIGLNSKLYSTHSLRRTKAKEIYTQTRDVESIRRLLGHSSIAATHAYLGVDRDEVEQVARRVEI